MKINFYQFKDENITVDITAVLENGKLTFNGFDYGKKVEDSRGVSSEYEYSLSLDNVNTDKLFTKLGIADKKDEDKLGLLKEKFGKDGSLSAFKEYCDMNEIETKFFCWP